MQDATASTASAAAAPAVIKKRPRLDLATDSRERKRGKTMFGLVLNTLNKAKVEDSRRNNSEAVRKPLLYLLITAVVHLSTIG